MNADRSAESDRLPPGSISSIVQGSIGILLPCACWPAGLFVAWSAFRTGSQARDYAAEKRIGNTGAAQAGQVLGVVGLVINALAGVLLLVLVAVTAHARNAYLYSNFGYVFDCGENVWQVSSDGPQPGLHAELATPFRAPDGRHAVQSVDLVLCRLASSSSVTISIHADADGRPGASLHSVAPDQVLPHIMDPGKPGVTTLDFAGAVILDGRQRYWVVMSEGPDAHIGWYEAARGPTVTMLRRIDGGEWLVSPGSHRGLSMRVRAERVP